MSLPRITEIEVANGVAKIGDYVIYQQDPLYPETRPYAIARICHNGEIWTSGGRGYTKYFEIVTKEQYLAYCITHAKVN